MEEALLSELWSASRSVHEVARELEAMPGAPDVLEGLELAASIRRSLFDAIDGRARRDAIERAEATAIRAAGALAEQHAELGGRLLASVRKLVENESLATAAANPSTGEWMRTSGPGSDAHALRRQSIAPRYRALPLPRAKAVLATPPPRELTGESITSIADLESAAARFEALAADSLAQALAPPPFKKKPQDPFAEPAEAPRAAPFEIDRARARTMTPNAFVERRVEELFQEVRMGGVQRTPQRGESFDSVHEIERRMFEAIDAIAAFGRGAIDCMERLGTDSPAPDSSRVFAAGLLASSIRGSDLFAMAERVLEIHGAHDAEMQSAFIEGLALGRSSDVDGALAALARHPARALRLTAIRAFARRSGCPTRIALEMAADNDASVAFAAVGELLRARHPEARNRLEIAWASLGAETPSSDLDREVSETLALAGDARRKPMVEARLDTKDPRHAALELAVIGDLRNATQLERRVRDAATEMGVLALGFAGSLTALPTLENLLEHADDGVADAAARALARLLGVFPVIDALVPPEELDEIPLTASPHDRPKTPGAPDRVKRLSRDPLLWRTEARRLAEGPLRSARCRHGRPWTPLASAEELAAHVLPIPPSPLERSMLRLELVFRAGIRTRFSIHDLVVTQEAQLAVIVGEARSSSLAAGSF